MPIADIHSCALGGGLDRGWGRRLACQVRAPCVSARLRLFSSRPASVSRPLAPEVAVVVTRPAGAVADRGLALGLFVVGLGGEGRPRVVISDQTLPPLELAGLIVRAPPRPRCSS